jgi:hypothetical protein
MKAFYVVLYDFDKKASPSVIPGSWIYPQTDKMEFAARRYIYYDNVKEALAPSTNAFFSLIRDASKENPIGCVYPGCVLAGFSKFLVRLQIFKYL